MNGKEHKAPRWAPQMGGANPIPDRNDEDER
jgi:hypothetical protein